MKLPTVLAATTVALGLAVAGIGTSVSPASAAAPIETMSVWRLQVRVTTGDTANAGTNGVPAVRLNSSSDGVRVLNPPNSTAFDRGHVDTYDLRLLAAPSSITMLRLGIAGGDDWCVRRVALIINGRAAFDRDAVPGGACATIGPGTYVEFSSTDLRTNPAWANYGTPPPLPTGLSAAALRAYVISATGSAMRATPGVVWDPANPMTLTTGPAKSIAVSYRIRIYDPAGIESPFTARITYNLRFFVGADGRLHVVKENASCCYHYGMSDAVAAQLDTALSRMTARPLPYDPLRFGIDPLTNITWSFVPVIG
jgi:hypothetical protein